MLRGAAERQKEALKRLRSVFVGWVACPLLAQSGHHHHAQRCPLSGVKRTFACSGRMGAAEVAKVRYRPQKSGIGLWVNLWD
jgi:hypothetical protein